MEHFVIIGATSSIAEHCARLWAQQKPVRLTLVGRNEERTKSVASDLRVRSPQSDITVLSLDFVSPNSIQKLVDLIYDNNRVDCVLIAHGNLTQQSKCQENLLDCYDSLQVNGISPVLFAEAFSKQMSKRNHGTLALIGSVAGDRGRASNYIYGAAKGLISRYAQGLQHRFSGTKVKVVLIKPGPTETPMTRELTTKGLKLAPVELVAREIIAGIKAQKTIVFTPSIWKYLMLIIVHLPNFIYNKIKI
jgi:decaprenylphospho-beta-D-erythro-pentofuranosid-2-ulose 2-reductase